MQIIALKPEHLLAVQMQPAQAWSAACMTPAMAQEVAAGSVVGATAVQGGCVIACAGLIELHPGRAQAWAMFACQALAHFKTIHRVVGAVLSASRWRRIEMYVDCQHEAACRWAARLGFDREGRLRAVTPDGRDCYLYARMTQTQDKEH